MNKEENYILFNDKKQTIEFYNHFDAPICAILTSLSVLSANSKLKGVSDIINKTKKGSDIPNQVMLFTSEKQYGFYKEFILLLVGDFLTNLQTNIQIKTINK